jgi:nucleotide-binding universal stress UspA family protein
MPIKMKRILFPTDFSDSSEHAFLYAVLLAEQFHTRLDILHVVEDVPFTQHLTVTVEHVEELLEQMAADDRERLKKLYGERIPPEVEITMETVRGAPFAEILAASDRNHSDLVIMGTHGRTGLGHMLMGSTAEKVVRRAHCPVLTIRHPEHCLEHP